MTRAWWRLAAMALGTILLGSGPLAIYLVATGSPSPGEMSGLIEAGRQVFLFMDIGLGVWVLLLILTTALGEGRRPTVRMTLLLAVVGVVANLLTVIVVGIVQQGWAPEFIRYAIQAGVSFLLAAALVVPLVHRLLPPRPATPAPALPAPPAD